MSATKEAEGEGFTHFARMHAAFAQQLTQRGVQGLEFRALPSAKDSAGAQSTHFHASAPIVVELDDAERALLAQMSPVGSTRHSTNSSLVAKAATPGGQATTRKKQLQLRLDFDEDCASDHTAAETAPQAPAQVVAVRAQQPVCVASGTQAASVPREQREHSLWGARPSQEKRKTFLLQETHPHSTAEAQTQHQ